MATLTEKQVSLLKEAEPTAKGTPRYYWKTTDGKNDPRQKIYGENTVVLFLVKVGVI